MSNSNNSTLRQRVTKNVLNRSKTFTRTQVAQSTRVSIRHVSRVLSELVQAGDVIRTSNGQYLTA